MALFCCIKIEEKGKFEVFIDEEMFDYKYKVSDGFEDYQEGWEILYLAY